MMRKIIVYAVAVFVIIFLIPLKCFADTAMVLPKGVFSLDTTYIHYFDIEKRYNPDGDLEDISIDYNTDLTSNIFPLLSALDPLVGGRANIGQTFVDFTLIYRTFKLALSYGFTDKFSFGFLLKYTNIKREVEARLDTSNANVGKSVMANNLVPLSAPFPDVVPLTTEDIQDLLGDGLDINGDGMPEVKGYGYKRFETWSESGICDLEFLGKYQFYKKENWRLAFSGGVRLPTGEQDDPDSLVDVGFGDGQIDFLFRLHIDYTGIRKLLLNSTIRYDIQLPDEEELRISRDVNLPLTNNKELVDRDLGDVIELELMGSYSFTPQFSAGLKYSYTKKYKDVVEGEMDLNYSSLEKETDSTSHLAYLSLGYSTVQMYLAKRFTVPFSANISYRTRFAGKNNVYKADRISLNFTVYF
jgi:hypothetical protein